MIPATWKTGLAAGAAVALAFGAWWVHARFTDLQEQLQVKVIQRDQARVGSVAGAACARKRSSRAWRQAG